MPRCFVIQPFDEGGPYDKRYRDVLLPAIKDAGLDAYRVDEDPSSSVLIDDIENNIRSSEICLADITPDNPNIWYEVGFAFANNRPVVMICAKPRPKDPPFDVRHRHLIYYKQDSPSDFAKLKADVTERTDIATSLSLESLQRQALIEYREEQAGPYGEETYTVCTLTSRGLDWVLENRGKFKLLNEETLGRP